MERQVTPRTLEKRLGPGKEQKGHAGDGASASPSVYVSRVALLYQNLLMLRINRSHPAVVERTDLYLKSWSATLAGWPQASHNPSLTYKMGIPPPTLQCLYITVAAPRPAPFISRQKTRPYYLVLVLPLKGEEGKLALLILSQCHSAFHLCLPDKLHFFLFLSFCSDWPSYSKMECIPIGQPQTQAPSFSLTFTTHQSGNF